MSLAKKIKLYEPLIMLFLLISLFTILRTLTRTNYDPNEIMADFMAGFFIIFGSFKLLKLSSFAEAYNMYDIIAKRFYGYGYIYPFIEIFLGVAYLFRFELFYISIFTLILMLINSWGALKAVRSGQKLMCACMGTVFKVPMSYVTLFEDLLMAVMAASMIFWY